MIEPGFSVEKFRHYLKNKTRGTSYPFPYPSPYWSFYYEDTSTVYHLDERKILAMSDEEILEEYIKWRIES